MGLSFGLLSFAGFEQVATLGEEVKKSRFTIPRVLIGTVLGAGIVFTLVTAAQTLGFGTDPAGVASFTKSTSLLADLSARYFGGWSGDLFDALAICSALGGALAAIVAASRILFALCRDLAPSSPIGRISEVSGTPRNAAVCVVLAAIMGYGAMRIVFHASGSDAFFWGSTLGALALLIAYLLVVVSAAGALIRPSGQGMRWLLFIPAACGFGDRLHVLGQCLPAPAWGLSGDSVDCPRLVLCTRRGDSPQSQTCRSHYVAVSQRQVLEPNAIERRPSA